MQSRFEAPCHVANEPKAIMLAAGHIVTITQLPPVGATGSSAQAKHFSANSASLHTNI